tara:strand:+ start:90 stop:377 length:288 start_codon:yes stop_codon:yes gene_type:complete
MKKILALLLVIGLLSTVGAEEKEKPTLKGWGDLLFKALDGKVKSTKEYQKEKWNEGKEQVKDLGSSIADFFGFLTPKEDNEKEWNEIDKEREGKE